MTPATNTDRTQSLGASEIGAVAGVHPYSNALQVWADKTGEPAEFDQATLDRMEIGNVLERPVLQEYARRNEMTLEFPPKGELDADHPWLSASLDAIAIDGVGRRRGAECKIVGSYAAHRWGPVEDGVLGVPNEVLCQVQQQMRVRRLELNDVVALIGTDLRVYTIDRDDAVIAHLIELGRHFWHTNVIPRVAPPLEGGNATRTRKALERCYGPENGETITLEGGEGHGAMIEAIREYALWSTEARSAGSNKDEAGNTLRALLGDNSGCSTPDRLVRATWTTGKDRVDWKAEAERMREALGMISEAKWDPKGTRTHLKARLADLGTAAHFATQGQCTKPGSRTLRVHCKEEG